VAEQVKIAVIGGGYGTKVSLPVLSGLPEFDPVAIWSRRPERARELADDAGLELGTGDVDELLDHPGLEAVHVANPVTLHAEVAIAAAQRGLHVLCEKPVAADLDEAVRVADAIESAGVVGAVNFGRRMQQTRERLLQRVREVVGVLRMVSVALVHDDHAEPDSRPFTWVQDADMGGGRLQGYGVHDLDLLLEAFGEVEGVAAATDVGVPERVDEEGRKRRVTAEDTYALLLRFREGGIGVVTFLATARHKRGDVVEAHGEGGTVRLDAEKRLWWGRAGEDLQCEGPLEADSKAAFGQVARNFWSSIREGAPPDPSLAEGLRAQALLDAVYGARSERRWVEPRRVSDIR
jgi:predicted dehydrogenase